MKKYTKKQLIKDIKLFNPCDDIKLLTKSKESLDYLVTQFQQAKFDHKHYYDLLSCQLSARRGYRSAGGDRLASCERFPMPKQPSVTSTTMRMSLNWLLHRTRCPMTPKQRAASVRIRALLDSVELL